MIGASHHSSYFENPLTKFALPMQTVQPYYQIISALLLDKHTLVELCREKLF